MALDSQDWERVAAAREAEMLHREKRVEAMIGRMEAVAATIGRRPARTPWGKVALACCLCVFVTAGVPTIASNRNADSIRTEQAERDARSARETADVRAWIRKHTELQDNFNARLKRKGI